MIGLSLAAALSLQAAYPDYRRLTDDQVLALDCESMTMDADRFLAECVTAQADVWEKRVRVAHAAAMKRLDPEMRSHVAKAQTAWKVFADDTCSQ